MELERTALQARVDALLSGASPADAAVGGEGAAGPSGAVDLLNALRSKLESAHMSHTASESSRAVLAYTIEDLKDRLADAVEELELARVAIKELRHQVAEGNSALQQAQARTMETAQQRDQLQTQLADVSAQLCVRRRGSHPADPSASLTRDAGARHRSSRSVRRRSTRSPRSGLRSCSARSPPEVPARRRSGASIGRADEEPRMHRTDAELQEERASSAALRDQLREATDSLEQLQKRLLDASSRPSSKELTAARDTARELRDLKAQLEEETFQKQRLERALAKSKQALDATAKELAETEAKLTESRTEHSRSRRENKRLRDTLTVNGIAPPAMPPEK